MMDSADPLKGWPIKVPMMMAKPAKNDIYGGLYNHLMGTFHRFCSKLRTLNAYFYISQVDAAKLSSIFGLGVTPETSFDRIEVILYTPTSQTCSR